LAKKLFIKKISDDNLKRHYLILILWKEIGRLEDLKQFGNCATISKLPRW
jgi:hypothetical protein